jgi:NAD(P)-dependent dehydrogenase (short-subunit alcohol dehydrogenase family)
MAIVWEIINALFRPRTRLATFPPRLSFTDRSGLITGATSGLRIETAIHYVNLGADPVIITTRNALRGAEAQKTIEECTVKAGVIQVRTLDIDTSNSVEVFVDSLKAEVRAIDIVLLNAGVHNFIYEKSPDGWESDLQVNLLSNTLLRLLILPWMRAVKKPGQVQHLSFVSSGHHMAVDILAPTFPKQDMFKYFNGKKNYTTGRDAYGVSKLFLEYAKNKIANLCVEGDGR